MILIILLLVAVFSILLFTLYYLYTQIFCYPKKLRPAIRDIPESNLYRTHREAMLSEIQKMETTPFEDVRILSTDGLTLHGRMYLLKEGAPLVIFFHGFHGVFAWDGYGFFKLCTEHGINILMVDERTHGESEGRAITFGIKERYDCKMWTEYATKRFGNETTIFLAGVSMGAASVMMASELGLPDTVKGIIADCGYSEPSAIIKETIRQMNFPVNPVYQILKLGAHLFGHFNLEEASALEAVQTLQIPILLIHGTCDSIVPPAMCQWLYDACTASKDLLLVDGADHANSALTDYAAYEAAVITFISNQLAVTS